MCRKKEAEFVLRYVDIDEAIRVNSEYKSDDFFDEITKVFAITREEWLALKQHDIL